MFPADLMITASEFHKVGAATKKALIPMFVSTLGTKGRSEIDD